jgi:hypothetical protein
MFSFLRRKPPVKTVPKLHVVNRQGQLMIYQGQRLEFDPSDRERAETIAWLASRNATNGPFEVREVQVPATA